ncbi:hypothetical protein Mgra_00005662 [Meloidogyne graminicola]|uniref:LITAF domain-containing protein n=1 Tax=Meloidogyne graminicola TaxID=189291 RepID=A0A8S9ZNB3_9BILA|nr:hypothetical protein Mgra_00005662 [Meloidogyne graminicola]
MVGGPLYSSGQYVGRKPRHAFCKNCQDFKLTKITYVNGYCICLLQCIPIFFLGSSLLFAILSLFTKMPFIASLSLLFFGIMFLPLCLFSYCNGCKDVVYHCSECEGYIGRYIFNEGRRHRGGRAVIYKPIYLPQPLPQ